MQGRLFSYANFATSVAVALWLSATLVCLNTAPAHGRQITDMAGRSVTVPDTINKVYSPSPIGANLLYTLDYRLLPGVIFPLYDLERDMLHPSIRELPVIGSVTGDAGALTNPEAVLAMQPDLVLMFVMDSPAAYELPQVARGRNLVEQLGLPYLYVFAKDLRDYPAVYEFLGDALGLKERAGMLADYIHAALSDAERVVIEVPPAQRPKVYYAEQLDGLSTENSESFHTSLLKLAGDVNVHRQQTIKASETLGYEKLSLERIIGYDPDIILAYHQTFYESVYQNSGWKHVKAVQNQKVLWIPRGPWNWFDRPPAFMQALGLKWLLLNLYPEHYQIDIVDEAVRFYRLFLWSDVTHDEMRKIIYSNAQVLP